MQYFWISSPLSTVEEFEGNTNALDEFEVELLWDLIGILEPLISDLKKKIDFWNKIKKYSDQLSTTALVRRNATKNLENSCFILNQLY